MRVLVWQDHGQSCVLSGELDKIADRVIYFMSHYYDQSEIEYVSQYENELDFERRVKFTTTDDECFEQFEFVNIQEV